MMAALLVPGVSLNWQPLASQWRGESHGAATRRRAARVHGAVHPTVRCFKSIFSPPRLGAVVFSANSFKRKDGIRGHRRLSIFAALSRNDSVKRRTENGEKSTSREAINPTEFEKEVAYGASEVSDVSNDALERKEEPAEEKLKREYLNFRADLEMKRNKFWHHFREQHEVYNMERKQWGVGFSPIFTVHEDKEGNLYRVDVNEEEIYNRTGINPAKVEFADEEMRTLAQQRIDRAHSYARDIELGLVRPSPLSILYHYEREGFVKTANLGSWVGSKGRSFPNSSPLQYLSLIPLFLPVVFVGVIVKLLFSIKKKKDPVVEEKEVRLMRMRKLKAQMGRASQETVEGNRRADVDDDVGDERIGPTEVIGEIVEDAQPRVDDEEFQRKVIEIRAMARKARLQEQESAESRSAQNFERKKLLEQELKKERNRVQTLENLAKDLDVVRRLGEESPDDPQLVLSAVPSGEDEAQNVKNGPQSSSQMLGPGSDSAPTSQMPGLGNDSSPSPQMLGPGSDNSPGEQPPRRSISTGGKSGSPVKPTTGVKPRIILSAEEARASIAAKKARHTDSSPSKAEEERSKIVSERSNAHLRKVSPPADETPYASYGTKAERSRTETSVPTSDKPLEESQRRTPVPIEHQAQDSEKSEEIATGRNLLSSESEVDKLTVERTKDGKTQKKKSSEGSKSKSKSKEEEEEMEWMRDEVLREIVFKVQANEEAGREPFHDLNSEQETLFFKGLERKYKREGDAVKTWIKNRVENVDYGLDGIGLHDTPDSYELKWKEGAGTPLKSDLYNQFNKDHQQILDEQRELTDTSSPGLEEPSPPSFKSSSSASSPAPSYSSASSPPSHSSATVSPSNYSTAPPPPDSVPASATSGASQSSKEYVTGSGKKRTVVSSSPRTSEKTFPLNSTASSTKENNSDTSKEWEHTKKWSKDLQRKYEMERDPETRAAMREIGQDLDRWITEDEIEMAGRLLDKGVEGEEEYAKMHYEKMKEKIKQQMDMFGRDAMLNKYSEYKPEEEEIELWWLDLPFVLCLGLQTKVDGESRSGLYSVDVSMEMEGLTGNSSQLYHTVAFQDRGDAQNFCTLISTQPEKVGADNVELVPFNPKELYEDAKSEGFKVTVIKKGQLRLSVDQPFEEAESRIMEICSSRYYDELLRDRAIDMEAVVDEGLGYGKRP